MVIGIAAVSQNNYEVAFNAFVHRATASYILNRLNASLRDIERTLAL